MSETKIPVVSHGALIFLCGVDQLLIVGGFALSDVGAF
jgi:hypothetical protein